MFYYYIEGTKMKEEKNKKKMKSLEDRLFDAKKAAHNAFSSQEIRLLLEKYGYEKNRLKQGISLCETAEKCLLEQRTKKGELGSIIHAFDIAREKADKTYLPYMKVARIALQGDNSTLQKLNLKGDRKRAYPQWLTQVIQFYKGVLKEPGILERLKHFGITKEKLEAGMALVQEAESANVRKELKKGEVQAAIEKRNRAFQEMNKYVANLIKIARIATVDEPERLEALGVVYPSKPKKNQKKSKSSGT